MYYVNIDKMLACWEKIWVAELTPIFWLKIYVGKKINKTDNKSFVSVAFGTFNMGALHPLCTEHKLQSEKKPTAC